MENMLAWKSSQTSSKTSSFFVDETIIDEQRNVVGMMNERGREIPGV